jgi:hypothetical protein
LFLSNASSAASHWRPAMSTVYAPLTYAFAALGSQNVGQYISTHNVEMSFMQKELPINVDVVSLQSWGQWSDDESMTMLRVAHMFAAGEDAELSQPISLDLATFFPSPPTSVQAMSLTLNRKANDPKAPKLHWNLEGENKDENIVHLKPSELQQGTVITLNPMEIQSFLVSFN